MQKEEIFDAEGHLWPIKPADLDISSTPEKVNYYGAMYTRVLVSDSRKGVKDFELFMELHRRATQRYLLHDTRYEWDQKVENVWYKNANAIFVRDYDRKWQVFQRGGLTYMSTNGEILRYE
jgi:hypothetical protein